MALTVLLMIFCLPHEASALGRLFFTPGERLELERQVKVSPDSFPQSQRSLTVNGWLSGGKRIRWWFDGRLSEAKGTPASVKVLPGAIRIRWQGRWLALKPGQVARKNPQGRISIYEFEHDSD